MPSPTVVERDLALPATLEAPGLAREVVTHLLGGGSDLELVQECSLLVSEVVTNAVIHGAGERRLRCRTVDGWIRVEVHDDSPVAPAVRSYSDEAVTGRGIELVELLSAAWGVAPEDAGKTVWFELGEPPPGLVDEPPAIADPGSGPGRTVVLVDAPVPLVAAAVEHADAILREVAYLALGGQLAEHLPQGWHPPALDVTPLLDALAAAPTDRARADLAFAVDPRSAAGALDRLALVDLAEQLAREGRLLAPPAVPEVSGCRRWTLTEIASQLAGAPPSPWVAAEPIVQDVDQVRLEPHALPGLDAATGAVIVADDANRIVYANAATAELLGWPEGDLVGRRLLAIIPPHLREAHLAGFTRVQLGGAARILGRPVVVPALRRDGTTVEVRLTIEPLTTDRARTSYLARLAPAPHDDDTDLGP